jgi:hypothetical protein
MNAQDIRLAEKAAGIGRDAPPSVNLNVNGNLHLGKTVTPADVERVDAAFAALEAALRPPENGLCADGGVESLDSQEPHPLGLAGKPPDQGVCRLGAVGPDFGKSECLAD